MDRYIGFDAHTESCTLAVMGPSGKRLKEQVLETNGKLLIEAIQSIAGTRHLCLEEGTHSEWLYELLEPHVDQLVVVQPQKRQGYKNDAIDAWELANRIRTSNFGRRVFKAPRRVCGLRQAVRAHRVTTQDMVRAKNRLKAIYRSRGISGTGEEIYNPKTRSVWLRKLPSAYRTLAELFSVHLDAMIEAQQRSEQWLQREGKQVADVARLMSVPGLGPIRAAQIVATVITPERFRKKRQFWSYCGLGIVTHSSSNWERQDSGKLVRRTTSQTRGLNRNCRPMLKEVFKGAAQTVISIQHPLKLDYERSVAAGMDPGLAVLTIARRIASAALTIWKRKEDYDPEKHRSHHAA
jgi:transposase